jgi:type II secretory pathway predicted ATPase ExeA
MYEAYYGFTGKPFEIIPDPNFLYLSPNHNHALDHLKYAIARNSGIILLTGEVGSGKTTLIQYLKQRIDENVELAVISNTSLPADQLISYILIKLNIEPEDNNKAYNLHYFKIYLKGLQEEGRRAILVFDEAQNLPKDALEEIRMLSNFQSDERLPMQIFLVGQPELKVILKSPGMNQIRQRIAVSFHLKGLSDVETQRYVAYRLKKAGATKSPFTLEAVKLIFQASAGIPRSINNLCDSALIYGFAEEIKTVGGIEVKTVLSELDLLSVVENDASHLKLSDGVPGMEIGINVPRNGQVKSVPEKEEEHIMEREPMIEPQTAEQDKRVLQFVNKQLAKIEFKLDQYRDEFLKAINDAFLAERRRFEKLLVENAKIQAETKMLKTELETTDRECKNLIKRLSEIETTASDPSSDLSNRSTADSNVYKIEK